MKIKGDTDPSYRVSSFLLSFPISQSPTLWPFTAKFSSYSVIFTHQHTSVWFLCPPPFKLLKSVSPGLLPPNPGLPCLCHVLWAPWSTTTSGQPPSTPTQGKALPAPTRVCRPPTSTFFFLLLNWFSLYFQKLFQERNYAGFHSWHQV